MVNTLYKSTTMAVLLCGIAFSGQNLGVPSRTELPTDGLTLGTANNSVALQGNPSSVLWNPAALALSCTPHIQLSFGGQRPFTSASVSSDIAHTTQTSSMGLKGAAIVFPVSSYRGSKSVAAFSIQTPLSLDQYLEYSGNYQANGNTHSFSNSYLAGGSLNFWSTAYSVALSPILSTGASLSIISGSGFEELKYTTSESPSKNYHINSDRQYLGYDLRLGFQALSEDGLSLGMRVELPSVIAFTEDGTQTIGSSTIPYVLHGTLSREFSGAAGFSLTRPGFTLCGEINGNAPVQKRTLDQRNDYWKVGAGIAFEFTLIPDFFTVRTGYTWQEYDEFPYVVQYEESVISDDYATDTDSESGSNLLSAGVTVQLARNVMLDGAFAQRFGNLVTNGKLFEHNATQIGILSVTVGY